MLSQTTLKPPTEPNQTPLEASSNDVQPDIQTKCSPPDVSIGSRSIAMTPSASPNSLTPASTIDTLEMAQNLVEIPRLPIESGDESLPTPSNSLAHHDEEHDPDTLDLSGQDFQKLSRAAPECTLNITTLILDNNSLQRLDNIHTYQCIEKLSVQNNRLIRMFQVAKLSHLKILNLAGNHISVMEGLKELKLLTWLSLSTNQIKSIDQLNQNVHLEHLDLSGNQISHISDLSYLKNLKVLLLHKNQLTSLRGCEKLLPLGINTLTLNDNRLTDLCDVSHLNNLVCMEQLTITNNPAIHQPEDVRQQFDYRPYVINWCLSLRVLDGILVGAKESLKAEWMYSQSRGRQFSVGQHVELLEYLLQVCPLHPGDDWQEDKKLNLILSKVQEHQQSLRETTSLPPSAVMSPRQGYNTLPRSHADSPMRSSSNFQRKEMGNGYNGPQSIPTTGTANSSASTTPTATPNVLRRSSFGNPPSNSPVTGRSNVRRNTRTSPSPVRRRTLTPTSSVTRFGPPAELGAYNLALPRTLYGDDINGNNQQEMMTQSMDPSKLASRLDNGLDLMTASLDPSIFMSNMTEEYRVLQQEGGPTTRKSATDAWSGPEMGSTSLSRPNSLFSTDSYNRQEVKDLYLQDLSDSELSQSLMYSRLQSRLNPVPESLNSPDIPPPSSTCLSRPARDDPVRVYNRDLAISSSTVSTTSSSRSADHGLVNKTQAALQALNGGYSSSSDGEQRNSSKATTVVNATIPKASPSNVNRNKNQKPKPQQYALFDKEQISPKIDTGLGGKVRPTSAARSLSLGRKTSPANKQLMELKKEYNSGSSSATVKTKETLKRSLSQQNNDPMQQDDEISTVLRHSADDEDDGDDVDVARIVDAESSHSESSERLTFDQRYQMRKSRSARRSTSVNAGMSERAQSPAKSKLQGIRGEIKLSRSQSGRMTVGPYKYAPERYSDRESVTPRSATLPSSSRTASRRTSEVGTNLNSSKTQSRPNSAINRPRSNTMNNISGSTRDNSAKSIKAPQSSAATTIQKNWRGHNTRNNDDRVQELKDEVRSLRTDQHIRHLTKELTAAKLALERERKLRALQMDAIKVLWKEVQLMDDRNSKSDNDQTNPTGIHAKINGSSKTRPSGSSGSKISSRQSEHSIAKLVETLEATAGVSVVSGRSKDTDHLPSNISSPATPANLMAQSMPPSLLSSVGITSNIPGNADAVEALSRTCTNLQRQVEMLQSSLSGVMSFMSNFSNYDNQQSPAQQRTRHSSTASTNQDSFCYYPSGPMSLPLISTTQLSCLTQQPVSLTMSAFNEKPPGNLSVSGIFPQDSDNTGVAGSKSCDCLTQTEISAVLTPKNECPSIPANSQFPFLHLKQVDIPQDSSGDSDVQNSSSCQPQTKRRDRSKSPRPQTLPGLSKDGKPQDASLTKIPGHAQLAERALADSPHAPQEVKAFAKNLVDGVFSDAIAKQTSPDPDMDYDDDKGAGNNEETDVSLSLAAEEEPDLILQVMESNNKTESQISAPSVGTKPCLAVHQHVEEDTSSHVDTDSLEDNSEGKK